MVAEGELKVPGVFVACGLYGTFADEIGYDGI